MMALCIGSIWCVYTNSFYCRKGSTNMWHVSSHMCDTVAWIEAITQSKLVLLHSINMMHLCKACWFWKGIKNVTHYQSIASARNSRTAYHAVMLCVTSFEQYDAFMQICEGCRLSARPYESCKIFKGWPRRNAFSKLLHRQYKSFPPDRFCQVEIKKTSGMSNKHCTA